MFPPIRCNSCNNPIGNMYDEYKHFVTVLEKDPCEFGELKKLRMCCRVKLFSYIDTRESILLYLAERVKGRGVAT